MGVYLGYVKIVERINPFYNFKPTHRIHDNVCYELSEQEQIALLPESEYLDINFSYNLYSGEDAFMRNTFANKSIWCLDFLTSDLEDNINSYGDRNRTGYRVSAQDLVKDGKLYQIDSIGYYQIVKSNNDSIDFTKDTRITVDIKGLSTNSNVLLEYNDMFVGPYVVNYRDIDDTFLVYPQAAEGKYVVSGYGKRDCIVHTINVADSHYDIEELHFVELKSTATTAYIDIITDETLLESFKASLSDDMVGDGRISIHDTARLLEHYNSSALTGSSELKEIQKKRMSRLSDILGSEAELEDTLRQISESLCDLIVKHQNSSGVNALIEEIFDKNPDLIDRLQGTRIIKDQINDLKWQHEELQSQVSKLTEKREELQEHSDETSEQQHKLLLETDELYVEKKAALADIVERLGVADSIEAMRNKRGELESDNKYLETHKSRLENDSKNLETEFLDRVNNYHDKMVSISFDGFMANKMLSAAAQWEAKETEYDYETAVGATNAVGTTALEPTELVQYLYDTVCRVRPQYSRNTIINIAICLTQGFLTVFSGEPGSGKTSICNIMADVLGLNKIGTLAEEAVPSLHDLRRYVPVSVERGWTSKRDFIGYFNPLSKNFDKTNRRVYDALKLLDIEKRTKSSKYPFYILLDEANLSPMEYYWADFMNVCDELDENSQINLGDNNVFAIPETLHFVATINNDHTTESLSPRLIDRTWIVTLPQQASVVASEKLNNDDLRPILWDDLKRAFLPKHDATLAMSREATNVYDSHLIPHFKKERLIVSPRVDISIKKYCNVASQWLEGDGYGADASIVALDYALAQKVLPKITGSGDGFGKWLEELQSICNSKNLSTSADIVKDIIDRGNRQMKYYHFFR